MSGKRVLLAGASLLAIALGAHFFLRPLWIRKRGIELTPSRTIPPRTLPGFLQNDPAWASEKLGTTELRMSGHGCRVTSLCAVLADMGFSYDPGSLNRVFSEKGVYNAEGEIVWFKIREAVTGVDYEYGNRFDSEKLESFLLQGLLPVVKVRYGHTGAFHWVVLAGSSDRDGFLIYDPLEPSRQPISLDRHGRVYAYRVLLRR